MSYVLIRPFAASLLVLGLLVAPATSQDTPKPAEQAAPAPKPFEPRVGQDGKDVVWVPTAQALVDRMLDMARITVDDYVIDLGSGDGRTVITAARRGVKAHGIEYNPDMVALSKRNAEAAGVSSMATFVEGDIFKSDFTSASVITLFLLPDLNVKLRPILLDMKPGTRVVSNTFGMGDWNPDNAIAAATGCTQYCRASLWIVPAKVEGTWQLAQGAELTLKQQYQMLTGTLKQGRRSIPITGKMNGDRISFTAGRRIYNGQVAGGIMNGTFATETTWEAKKAP